MALDFLVLKEQKVSISPSLSSTVCIWICNSRGYFNAIGLSMYEYSKKVSGYQILCMSLPLPVCRFAPILCDTYNVMCVLIIIVICSYSESHTQLFGQLIFLKQLHQNLISARIDNISYSHEHIAISTMYRLPVKHIGDFWYSVLIGMHVYKFN